MPKTSYLKNSNEKIYSQNSEYIKNLEINLLDFIANNLLKTQVEDFNAFYNFFPVNSQQARTEFVELFVKPSFEKV